MPCDHLWVLQLPMLTPLYGGEDDLLLFQQWLLGLLWWLSTYMLTGPSNDEQWRQMLPVCLGGEAIKWYNTTVDAPNRVVAWTFEEIVLALHAQFITWQATIDAAFRFKNHHYNRTDGVLKFHHELTAYADQMVQTLDKFLFKSKFMDELPYEVVQHIVQQQGLSFKVNNLEEILMVALEWEGGDKVLQTWQKKKVNAWGSYRTQTPKMVVEPKPEAATKEVPNGKMERNPPMRMLMKSAHVATNIKPTQRDYSKMECWDCHELGHWAGDPICKTPKKEPRLRAA